MDIKKSIIDAAGLLPDERKKLIKLLSVYDYHVSRNAQKRKYYEGHISLGEVNLGLALPSAIRGLEIGCAWGEKAVDVLASRSMFDGFVGANGASAELMTQLMSSNNLRAEYAKACKDELLFGCTFVTLSADDDIGCRIRFHSPETAAAVWAGGKNRIEYGFAIISMMHTESGNVPNIINLYTDDAVTVLTFSGTAWSVDRHFNPMGRPLMVAMTWNATTDKPFGRSRLKEPVRRLIQGYVRTVSMATIGLEFSTAPQKYMLGITDQQYDQLIDDKLKLYIGSMLLATTNPETGEKPQFGQLAQGTIEPHVSMLRLLATQFSAATGLSATDTGVINDANPSSADAINAQSKSLILMAEQLNTANADALYNVAVMAQAIARNVLPDELTDDEKNVLAHFKNPAMPSVGETADAALKIASVRNGFGDSDVFLEMIGFDQADIRRIRAQESRSRGMRILEEIEQ